VAGTIATPQGRRRL